MKRHREGRDEEIRRALDPVTGEEIPRKRQFLQGKLTAVCLAISVAGALADIMGWTLPSTEINSVLTWIAANYDQLMFLAGQIGAAYGQLRRNWRRDGA